MDRPLSVLVVSSFQTFRQLEPLLEANLCMVAHTDRPNQVLRIVADCRIDLVITDAGLPGHLATELLSLLSRLHPNVFRVLFTPFDDLNAALAALNEGHAQRFLLQGGSEDHLEQVLAEARHEALRAFAQTSSALFVN